MAGSWKTDLAAVLQDMINLTVLQLGKAIERKGCHNFLVSWYTCVCSMPSTLLSIANPSEVMLAWFVYFLEWSKFARPESRGKVIFLLVPTSNFDLLCVSSTKRYSCTSGAKLQETRVQMFLIFMSLVACVKNLLLIRALLYVSTMKINLWKLCFGCIWLAWDWSAWLR